MALLGNYELHEEIGRGGMGVVYRAERLSLGCEVAVKVLYGNFAHEIDDCQHFQAEARIQAQINHPHVVRVFDFGCEYDHRVYYAMELLRGETLNKLICKEQISLPRALVITAQIAHALISVHEKGVVHRDVSPKNVHIERRCPYDDSVTVLYGIRGITRCNPAVFDHAKLADFGIAKIPGVVEYKTFGTPLYMAPEQIRDERVDERADIYGLGCLLYETIVGGPPFLADATFDALAKSSVAKAHLTEPPPHIRVVRPELEIPEKVERVILKALAKKPKDRQQTAREFLDELQECWRSIT